MFSLEGEKTCGVIEPRLPVKPRNTGCCVYFCVTIVCCWFSFHCQNAAYVEIRRTNTKSLRSSVSHPNTAQKVNQWAQAPNWFLLAFRQFVSCIFFQYDHFIHKKLRTGHIETCLLPVNQSHGANSLNSFKASSYLSSPLCYICYPVETTKKNPSDYFHLMQQCPYQYF